MNLFDFPNTPIVHASLLDVLEMKVASDIQIGSILLIIMSLIILYFVVKLIFDKQNKQKAEKVIFLAKAQKLGLTNNQIEVLSHIIKINNLSHNTTLVHDATLIKQEMFEDSIGQLIEKFKNQQMPLVNILNNVCKNISLVYEKIYYPAKLKKRLVKLQDITTDQIIYFTPEKETDKIFFGKIVSVSNETVTAKVFKRQPNIKMLENDTTIKTSMWRIADAEYCFVTNAKLSSEEGNSLEMSIPKELLVKQELVRPYIDVMIDCKLTAIEKEEQKSTETKEQAKDKKNQPPETVLGRIFKMNNHEIVVLVQTKLSQDENYWLDFIIDDFKFSFASKVIAGKFDQSTNTSQCTLDLKNLSPIASQVFKNYINSLI